VFIRKRPEKKWYDGFEPIYVWNDGNDFTIRCKPSRVEEVIPKSGVDCVVTHPIYYNGQIHYEEDDIDVPDGHTLYCKVVHDKAGEVQTGEDDRPELLVGETVPESSHWYPDDPAGAGAGGTMYFPLYKIDRVDGVAEITFLHWGPIIVRNDLWIGENLGSAAEVLKEHAETEGAVYKFRSIDGEYGIAHTQEAESDEIDLDFDAENHQYGTGQEVYVPVGDGDQIATTKAEFRTIDGGDSPRNEIEVYKKNAGTIGVRGNNVDRTITFDHCDGSTDTLVFVDGLLTSASDASFTHYGECNATTTAPS